jgi:DeoR/GlpR family transcriptional regulator of sugar metabolism
MKKDDLLPKTATGRRRFEVIKFIERSKDQQTTIDKLAFFQKYTHETARRHLNYLHKNGYLYRNGRFVFGLKEEMPADFDYKRFDTERKNAKGDENGDS